MYQEITIGEYRDYFSKLNIERFTKSEFNSIDHLLKSGFHPDYRILRYDYDSSRECINIYLHGRRIYNIDKMSDEWYMVAGEIKFYMCDQFDGLLEFLSDNLKLEMKHIKTFEAIRKPPIKNYQSVSEETLNKIQTELEDFLLYELDTYELSDQDGKSLKELPSYVPSRPRYVFNIRFKTPFTKSAESLSKRLNEWDNDYNFTLKSIECRSSSYWSEEREQSFTEIKITFDL